VVTTMTVAVAVIGVALAIGEQEATTSVLSSALWVFG
jgi:hypothetical protein